MNLADSRTVKIRIGSFDDMTIRGNADDLARAIINLLSNAISVSPPNSEVSIGVCRRDGKKIIQVKDQGKGLEEEEKERIFEAFVRSSSANYSGSGLGLAIVKAILDKHKGSISVASEPGVGSTFELIFNE